MASATGVPQALPEHIERADSGLPEEEPLLGRPGDACLPEGQPLYRNLYLGTFALPLPFRLSLCPSLIPLPGTAPIAQAGVLLLTILVWASIFLHPLSLFSFHPLLNSSAILFSTQAILILQPTHTQTQKRQGTLTHFTINFLAIDALIAAFVIIEYNKFAHKAPHFTSVHGKLGLITYCLLAIQALVGFTQYFVPSLYGGIDNAKAMYKWHRFSGYIILVMMLATVIAATQTTTGKNFLELKTWSVALASVLVLVGLLPRIRRAKLGYLGGMERGVSL